MGLWVGNLDDVFAGSLVAQQLAEAYRRRHNVGGLLTFVEMAVMFGSLFALDCSERRRSSGYRSG